MATCGKDCQLKIPDLIRSNCVQAEKLERLSETVSSTYVASEEPTRQNRKLLIDLGQFFEVLEYSCSSETPGSASAIFGASLRSGFSGSRAEIAQTSVLPQPTRVERQQFGSTPTTNQNTPLDGEAASISWPVVYSDDELAVLAESFFHQTQEFDANSSWWNTLNL